MAAPAYKGIGTASSASSATILTPTWPTHAANDIGWLVVTETKTSSSPPDAKLGTDPGFTQFASLSTLSGTNRLTVTFFWIRCASSSVTAPTITASTGTAHTAVIVTYSGCVTTGNPFDFASFGGAGSSTAGTTMSTLTGGSAYTDTTLMVLMTAYNANFSGETDTVMGGLTERYDTISNSIGLGIADVSGASPTGLSTTNAANSISTDWVIATLKLLSTTSVIPPPSGFNASFRSMVGYG